MYLKQIEVMGFKSFAIKTAIDFVPGVTAVVGPNGSGKSNITDAIRWVLGEQSARSLRGAKMEDIIFAGSDSKKALNVAEVTLVLDNKDQYLPYDYSEISVTRRVYRSGESDFLLNGQSCRLKDIVEMFMDSGLGREAYSIISQGKIDDILNSKAEEKRKIFEEAAGVFKYKTRKQTAEKKLNEAEDNLQRVEDIRNELEDQIEPLHEQASIAREYIEKKDQLEVIEVGLLAYDIDRTHVRWEEKNKSVEALKEKELTLATTIQTKEAEYESKQVYMQAIDESIEDLQESLLLSSELLEKLEGQRNVLNERQKHAEENATELKQQLEKLNNQQLNYQQVVQNERETYKLENEKLIKLKEELTETLSRYDNFEKDIEGRIEGLKNDYFDLLNAQTSMRNERRYLEEQKEQLLKKSDRLDNDQRSLDQRLGDLDAKRQELLGLFDHKAQELDQSRKTYQEIKNKIEELNNTYEKQRTSYEKMGQIINQAQSRKEMLEEMSQDYSGFFHGVKQVLKAKNSHLEGIEGAVAELIKVTKSHEVAIEIALGGAMQNIVVDNEKHARDAISFLKKNQAGRATFLPMSVVKSRFIQDIHKISHHESFVGIASDLITYEKKYENVLQHLLGHIIVAHDLKGANTLAREMGQRYRIVTLDGDVISPGGAMTGGSQKQKSSNLLGRKREVEQLTKQLKEMTSQYHDLGNKLNKNKQDIKEKSLDLEQLREKGQTDQLEKQEIEGHLKEINIQISNIQERMSASDHEKSNFSTEYKTIEQRLKELIDGQTENKGKETQLKDDIDRLTEQKKNQEASKEELQSTITDLKINVAEQQKVVHYQNEELTRIESLLQQTVQLLKDTKEKLDLIDRNVTDQGMNQETLGQKIEEARLDKEGITHLINLRRKERLDLYSQSQYQERDLKEDKRQHKGLLEALKNDEIALSRLDVELDNYLIQLREDYELTFEAAKINYPLSIAIDEARTKVKLLKKSIEELGTVNIGAIEEYERVSTRFNFLTEQKDDLIQAKETLLNVIYEMDQEVEKRFKETFDQVKTQFRVVFTELFGGGEADLCLTDPDDILYTGVDILAQPPGKKLQHLSLLSGGERALTAIALLFAILKVRPVPFCVLDEVEAALDDANVHRYAMFLKAFSKETQFIVVTHRKGTMEEADVLYGVTMQESGVSNLVSVRLEESKELIEAT